VEFDGIDGGAAFGGSIAVDGGVVNLKQVDLTFNIALGASGQRPGKGGVGRGGALFLTNSTATIVDTSFSSNSVRGGWSYHGQTGFGEGGALWSSSTLSLSNCVFKANTAQSDEATSFGGAIYNTGTLRADRVAVVGNKVVGGSAHAPGGLGVPGYPGLGGGVYNGGTFAATNITFLSNTAEGGPGIPFISSFIPSGPGYGGALYTTNNTQIAFGTFARNLARPGETGVYPDGRPGPVGEAKASDVFNSGAASLRDTILGSTMNLSVSGALTDGGYNIASDASAAFTQPTSLNSTDPNFANPSDLYVQLLPGSPAIDSADSSNFPPLDQLGAARPAGAKPDRGALELNQPGFSDMTIIGGSSIRLTVYNWSGKAIVLQSSNDDNTWTDIETNLNTGIGPFEFQTSITSSNQHFRIRTQP
jgi:hypothetical protein